jgi:hypothetical protein
MPLVASQLGAALADRWLPGDDGPYPGSAIESGQRFADVVSEWFANATAMGLPCATAQVRAPQLAALAGTALAARTAAGAGQQLGQAVGVYITAQLFGSGVAAAPTGMAALGPQLASVFADTGMARNQRGNALATPIYACAITTLVAFTAPPGSFPVV